jgi:hypothetical protein
MIGSQSLTGNLTLAWKSSTTSGYSPRDTSDLLLLASLSNNIFSLVYLFAVIMRDWYGCPEKVARSDSASISGVDSGMTGLIDSKR